MKAFIIQLGFLIFFLWAESCPGQDDQTNTVRQPVVAGSYYPADEQEIEDQLDQLFAGLKDKIIDENLAAIIVPHAGYVFSGSVAASAYSKIDADKSFSRIFIIGTSHHIMMNGASIYNQGNYSTPLGTVEVDTKLANQLIKENSLIQYVTGAHSQEHSIEVQLPFLQYRLKKPFKIVPIIISTQSANICKRLAEILEPYFTPDNLFIISSDFSHYPSYKDAVEVDQSTGMAISGNSPEEFIEIINFNNSKDIPGLATSCCGWSSILTLLDITSTQKDIRVSHLNYLNSGDSPYGDSINVVGYHAFAFTRDNETDSSTGYSLSPEEKSILLNIARETIENQLENNSLPDIGREKISENLNMACGAFVTLNKDGQLRGCIGSFTSGQPLYQVVQEMALASAFRDTRFMPVTKEEMDDIDIEISVLTPLKRIQSIDEFELGKHGIYMVMGNRRGTYLPQVAETTGWSKEEFLSHCASDKAGIGRDGWKDAELYIYEALVFSETE